jgi:hypothetical protein
MLNTVPFYDFGVKFRTKKEGECGASECKLIAKDFWALGFGTVI